MKKTLTAIAITMGMLVGGLVATAPAQAASNTTVQYFSRSGGVTTSSSLRITLMNGSEVRLKYGSERRGVKKVCPAGPNTGLFYTSPRGTIVTMAKGACTTTSLGGTYTFGMYL